MTDKELAKWLMDLAACYDCAPQKAAIGHRGSPPFGTDHSNNLAAHPFSASSFFPFHFFCSFLELLLSSKLNLWLPKSRSGTNWPVRLPSECAGDQHRGRF
jgi:hypothetical protein